jgi:hypothetical protein
MTLKRFQAHQFLLICTINKFNENCFAKRSCLKFIKKPLVGLGVLAK